MSVADPSLAPPPLLVLVLVLVLVLGARDAGRASAGEREAFLAALCAQLLERGARAVPVAPADGSRWAVAGDGAASLNTCVDKRWRCV